MRECGWFIGTDEYEQRKAEDSRQLRDGLDALRAARTAGPDDDTTEGDD